MHNLKTKLFNTSRAYLAAHCAPWPYIARGATAPSANLFFDTEAFRDRYRPGQEVTVYVAGCNGLLALARDLGDDPAIFKVGVTSGDIRHRLAQMAKDRYGSHYRSEGALACALGHDEWSAQQIEVTLRLSPDSPVRTANRGIRVRLPATLPIRDFDRQLAAALEGASLARFIESPMGQEYCSSRDLDPGLFRRMTAYAFGAALRFSAARELVFFRPRKDSDRLVVIVEDLIAAHVGALVHGENELVA